MNEFQAAVTTVIEDEPDGLRSVTIRERVPVHPDYDLKLPMKNYHGKLGELRQNGLIECVDEEKRYPLAE